MSEEILEEAKVIKEKTKDSLREPVFMRILDI